MQGYVDLVQCDWDAKGKRLVGRSKVVAGEPYKAVIALNGYKPVSASANGAKCTLRTLPGDTRVAELIIEPAGSATVDWSAVFAPGRR